MVGAVGRPTPISTIALVGNHVLSFAGLGESVREDGEAFCVTVLLSSAPLIDVAIPSTMSTTAVAGADFKA
jgi:hypothetical protein